MKKRVCFSAVVVLAVMVHILSWRTASAAAYDIVLSGGRVMNPQSGLNAVRNVGIRSGRIVAISQNRLEGGTNVDVTGLVVAPGFIDLHAHGQDEFSSRLQAQDGVTTHLELEGGVYPVAAWYESKEKTAVINFGATVSHSDARVAAMVDLAAHGYSEDTLRKAMFDEQLAAQVGEAIYKDRAWIDGRPTPKQLTDILRRVQEGLDDGALGIGYLIAYTPGATREEIFRLFGLARINGLVNFVHSRSGTEEESGGAVDAVQELLADAAATGASVHIVHIGSSGVSKLPLLLDMIDVAQANGIKVTTEIYPYTAWSTYIGAALFDGNWTERMGMSYGDVELPATGERLSQESFDRVRREMPAEIIIGHGIKEVNVTAAISHPYVMIASDAMPFVNGRAHPRGAGTFARVLGRYVREKHVLSLMEALAKMSYLPARLLENAVPQMKRKGRIVEGADADIVVFDPDRVVDRATFADPAVPSAGIEYVMVNGEFVVRAGKLVERVYPGRPVRRTPKREDLSR